VIACSGSAVDDPAVQAEILTIGDELCRGEIVDSNSSWLAAQLWELGVTVTWMTSCRDDRADMTRALGDAAGRADLILVSGGLGPTEDDLTVDVICAALGVGTVDHQPSLERMQARFARASFKVTPNNLRQVRVPAGATAWLNPAGVAPGFEVDFRGKRLMCFPGVPRELKALWAEHAVPRVRQLATGAPHLARKVYRVFGLGESHVDHRLQGLVAGLEGATLHFQVSFPETLVKVVVRDRDPAVAEGHLAALDGKVREALGDHLYGEGHDDSLAAALGRALLARQATLAVAESCTGGMIGSLMTDVPGSSAWFVGGWVTYANGLKEVLGVPAAVLAEHGAVSEACVRAMARAARERSGASHAVAVSGIAGPGGGSEAKPVGTVHLALSTSAGETHKHVVFPGARDQVRRLASYWAMRLVLLDLQR
jgi:nicotinamide-nucleotide amidase